MTKSLIEFPPVTINGHHVHPMIGKIRRAYFGNEDHGCLECFLDFNFGGSGQGTGGHVLDEPIRGDDNKFLGREGTAYGMQFLAAVMKAAGVSSWDKVEGRTVFAFRSHPGWGGSIVGLGPLPTEEGEPFIFDDLRAKHYRENGPSDA